MPASPELTEAELEEIVSALKDEDEDTDEDEVQMKVVKGAAVKQPSTVRVVDTDSIPIDDATRRKVEKDKARSNDKFLGSMKGNTADPRVLENAAEELAEEIFALKFERQRLEDSGRDIANTSGRRVTALKAFIDTHLRLRDMQKSNAVDFQGDDMKIIMRLIFNKIKMSLEQAGYGKQDIQAFFQVFQGNMDSFEVEAQRLIDQETK